MMKLAFITSLICFSTFAQEWANKGEMSFQWRRFEDDKVERSVDTGMLVFSRVESVYTDDENRHVFRGFARVDQKDSDRDFMAFEDVYFSHYLDSEQKWLALAGYKLFNWTATEAFHPADVINSRNFDSDLEYFEKLGEPTVELTGVFDWGSLSFFIWPRFEKPQFPGNRSRLGFGLDLSRPQAIQGTKVGEEWALQGGFRLGYTMDDGDLSFHVIHHVDRNFPIVGTTDFTYNPFVQRNVPNNLTAFTSNPTPYYFRKTQIGGTLQYALSNVLLKFEGAYRVFQDDLEVLTAEGLRKPVDHGEVAFGFEYTLPFSLDGADTYLFFEGGTILGTTKEERARLGAFQRDVLLGLRHSFNDVMGSELFVSMIHDVERKNERLYNLSYSRRLSDLWKASVGLRIYDAKQKGAVARGLESLDGAHHGLITVTRFF
ncbi:MAG: hypothetical protein K9K67_11350 [Bacteriovoracaceae bacterium]|nr:hypothetical protein [Bacteriovoracaceae bacterium]